MEKLTEKDLLGIKALLHAAEHHRLVVASSGLISRVIPRLLQGEALQQNYESMQQTNEALVNRLRLYNSFMVDLANELSATLDIFPDSENQGPCHEHLYKAWDKLRNALLDEMTGKGELITPTDREA